MRRNRPGRFAFSSAWLVPVVLASVVLVILSAGAVAALETNTVGSFPKGLWWALSLITTVGFIGEPPETAGGAVLSAVLMVVGFFLLAMVSASLAALFVREEEEEPAARLEGLEREILSRLGRLEERFDLLERRLDADRQDGAVEPPGSGPGPTTQR